MEELTKTCISVFIDSYGIDCRTLIWGSKPEVSSPFFEQIIIERKSKKEVTSMSEHDLIGFLRFNRQG